MADCVPSITSSWKPSDFELQDEQAQVEQNRAGKKYVRAAIIVPLPSHIHAVSVKVRSENN